MSMHKVTMFWHHRVQLTRLWKEQSLPKEIWKFLYFHFKSWHPGDTESVNWVLAWPITMRLATCMPALCSCCSLIPSLTWLCSVSTITHPLPPAATPPLLWAKVAMTCFPSQSLNFYCDPLATPVYPFNVYMLHHLKIMKYSGKGKEKIGHWWKYVKWHSDPHRLCTLAPDNADQYIGLILFLNRVKIVFFKY